MLQLIMNGNLVIDSILLNLCSVMLVCTSAHARAARTYSRVNITDTTYTAVSQVTQPMIYVHTSFKYQKITCLKPAIRVQKI